jgi:hypothetical protein
MNVNLRGAFLCSRQALDLMLPQNQGTIVNLFSTSGLPYLCAYTASKEGVRSMVHSLSAELQGRDIFMIGYGPGLVETPGGTAALKKLAPLIDMRYEELVESGLNSDYKGLVPAYDAALVLAHILCRPHMYHNQNVTMDEAARVLSADDPSDPEKVPYDCDRLVEILMSVRDQSQELLSAVESTDEEFSRLPFFVRTMARSGFRRKVGVPVGDLKDLLQNIHHASSNIVQAMEKTGPDPDKIPRPDITHCLLHCSQIVGVLTELEQYYEEVPTELSRFIRNEQELRHALESCQDRMHKAKSLRSAAESTRDL